MPTLMPAMLPTMTRSAVSLRSPVYSNRLYARRAVDLRARLLARQKADGRVMVVYGRTVDLSRTGAGLTLSRELASGTEAVLYLRLPGSDHVLCLNAVIIRRRGFRVGLRFVQPTAEQRLLLCEFCYS
jgi:hypothetical protein